jgi:hypothetical protein
MKFYLNLHHILLKKDLTYGIDMYSQADREAILKWLKQYSISF